MISCKPQRHQPHHHRRLVPFICRIFNTRLTPRPSTLSESPQSHRSGARTISPWHRSQTPKQRTSPREHHVYAAFQTKLRKKEELHRSLPRSECVGSGRKGTPWWAIRALLFYIRFQLTERLTKEKVVHVFKA